MRIGSGHAILLFFTFVSFENLSGATLEVINLSSGESKSVNLTSGISVDINIQFGLGDQIKVNWFQSSFSSVDKLLGSYSSNDPIVSAIQNTYSQYQIYSLNDSTSLKINDNLVMEISLSYPSIVYRDGLYTYTYTINTPSNVGMTISSSHERLDNKRTGKYTPGQLVPGTGGGPGSPPAQYTAGSYEIWQYSESGSELLQFTLIPEPSAFSLLAIGLGVVLRRRRRTV